MCFLSYEFSYRLRSSDGKSIQYASNFLSIIYFDILHLHIDPLFCLIIYESPMEKNLRIHGLFLVLHIFSARLQCGCFRYSMDLQSLEKCYFEWLPSPAYRTVNYEYHIFEVIMKCVLIGTSLFCAIYNYLSVVVLTTSCLTLNRNCLPFKI